MNFSFEISFFFRILFDVMIWYVWVEINTFYYYFLCIPFGILFSIKYSVISESLSVKWKVLTTHLLSSFCYERVDKNNSIQPKTIFMNSQIWIPTYLNWAYYILFLKNVLGILLLQHGMLLAFPYFRSWMSYQLLIPSSCSIL